MKNVKDIVAVITGGASGIGAATAEYLSAQGMKIAIATGDQFVWIGLVPYIPDNLVVIEIKGLIEREGEFHHPQTRPQMSTTVGHDLEMTFADLRGNLLQLQPRQTVQLIRMGQLAEMHALPPTVLGNLRGPRQQRRARLL